MERWLEGRDFVATDDFTVAEILMACVLSGPEDESPLQGHPNIIGYRTRCFARPAWNKVLGAYKTRVEAG